MFNADVDKTELRQGDIIAGLYCPLISCSKLTLIGQVAEPHGEEPGLTPLNQLVKGVPRYTAQIQMDRVNCIIISQCCELERRDDGKMKALFFCVAPLYEVPFLVRNSAEQLAALRENVPGKFNSLYFIPQHASLTQEYVVDLSRPISLSREDYDLACSKKILQLTDEERVKFKIKLGNYFGRPTEEELAAGLYPPGQQAGA